MHVFHCGVITSLSDDPFDVFHVICCMFWLLWALCSDCSLSVLMWNVLLLSLWSLCFPIFP